MTRERDRIQENASKYKVLNCPAYNDMPNMYDEIYGYCDTEHGIDLNKCMCENIADCVIKQVVEIAKDIIEKDCYENSDVKAEKILQLFDIEEIR